MDQEIEEVIEDEWFLYALYDPITGIMHLTYSPNRTHTEPASTAKAEGDGAPEIEITPQMVAAGMEAADLLSYQWGETPEVPLVCRVFAAMWDASPMSSECRWRTSEITPLRRHNL